ncbi:MAG: hypothetical protein QW699_00260 [Metallosphaera sp.]|uniref:hypothetical protein n=1 Tax=Saccharolobus sp. TaxID=2100761 RepID=UPI00315E883F
MIFRRKKNEDIRLSERVAVLVQHFEEAVRANDNARAAIYYNELMELIKTVCDKE